MNYYTILDRILEVLKEAFNNPPMGGEIKYGEIERNDFKYSIEIGDILIERYGIRLDLYELHSMLKFLCDEGYLLSSEEVYNDKPHKTAISYRILFKGIMFINNGGYERQQQDKTNQLEYRIRYEKTLLRHSDMLNRATWGLVIATILLVIVEVILKVSEHREQYHHFCH